METSAGQGEHGTGKSVKGSIRKIPSESVIRLWRNFLRQCLIRGLEVDFCSLPFRKKLYRRSIKNPNPFPIWKIWFGLYAFGAPGGIRTHGLPLRRRSLYPTELRVHVPENSVFSRVFRYFIVMISFSFLLTNRPVLGLSC